MKNINLFFFLLLINVPLFAAPQIPSIPWEVRSDWTNVKTPHT